MKDRKITVPAFLVLLLGSASFADTPGAPATVPADQVAEELELHRGNIDVRNGGVELRLNQQLAGPGGRGVQGVEFEASRNYVIGGADETGSRGLLLAPRVRARLDLGDGSGGDGVRRIEIDAGGLTLLRVQPVFRHGTSEEVRRAQALVREHNQLEDERRLWLHGRAGEEEDGGDDRARELARSRRLSEISRRCVEIREILISTGVDLRRGNRLRFHNADHGSEVHGVVDLRLGQFGFRHRNLDDAGVRQTGITIEVAQVSAHGAVAVDGINLDLCGAISPVAFVVGRNEGRDSFEFSASACLGAQLGEIGNLRHEASYSGDGDGNGDGAPYGQASFRTSLSRIGNLRGVDLGVSHTYEIERAEGGGRDTRHLIGVSAGY